jgi:hypothetical protein
VSDNPYQSPTPSQETEKRPAKPPRRWTVGLIALVVLMGAVFLLAIIIGIMCLLMEMGRYGGQIKPTQARVTGMPESHHLLHSRQVACDSPSPPNSTPADLDPLTARSSRLRGSRGGGDWRGRCDVNTCCDGHLDRK